MTQRSSFQPSRRIVFQGLGALGVAAVLAGCGGGDDDGGGGADTPDTGTELASTSEVPVGGGLVLADEQVVITQPTEGEFKAFSAVCTHQGCTVSGVEGGTINCACHGSKFDIATGEVKGGPATKALPEKKVTVGADGISVT